MLRADPFHAVDQRIVLSIASSAATERHDALQRALKLISSPDATHLGGGVIATLNTRIQPNTPIAINKSLMTQ